MATITVGAGNTMRPYRRCRVQHFKEAASQTFIVGDVLILDTSAGVGRVKVAGADPTPIVGVAAEAASGVTDAKVAVYVATGIAEFRANCDSSAVLSTLAMTTQYGIVADSTNVSQRIWRVDTSDTTNPRVQITEVPNNGGGTYGDTNAEVVFQFINDTPTTRRTPYVG